MERKKAILHLGVVNWLPIADDGNEIENRMIEYIQLAGNMGIELLIFPQIQEILCEKKELPNKSKRLQAIADKARYYKMSVLIGMDEQHIVYLSTDDIKSVNLTKEFGIVHTEWGAIGVGNGTEILSYPETLRLAATIGARLYVSCCAWKMEKGKNRDKFIERQQKSVQYAVENTGMYIAVANRQGIEENTEYLGNGNIWGPENKKGTCRCYGKIDGGRLNRAVIDLGDIGNKYEEAEELLEYKLEQYEKCLIRETKSTQQYKDIITIGVVNFRAFYGQKKRNLERICSFVESAAKRGVKFLIFPELALCGGEVTEEMVQIQQAELIPGNASNTILNLAVQHNMYIVYGMAEKDSETNTHCYNSAVLCKPDGSVYVHRKTHLSKEDKKWAIGGSRLSVWDTEWGPVGVDFDVSGYPESILMACAKGVRLFVNCLAVAKTADMKRLRKSLESATYMGDVYIANANLCGQDVENVYAGKGSIIGPAVKENEVVYYAGYPFDSERGTAPELIVATIDLTATRRDGGKEELPCDIYVKTIKKLLDK